MPENNLADANAVAAVAVRAHRQLGTCPWGRSATLTAARAALAGREPTASFRRRR